MHIVDGLLRALSLVHRMTSFVVCLYIYNYNYYLFFC